MAMFGKDARFSQGPRALAISIAVSTVGMGAGYRVCYFYIPQPTVVLSFFVKD